jgi:hypothetical protein
MKKVSIIFMLAIMAAGGVLGASPVPSQAQVYVPAPRPVVVATPYVGANTPWVYYQGDWFRNGVLYYFFGNQYGWAPYYAYAPTYIVRPTQWYAPRWNNWYKAHPVYWTNFQRQYPYWHDHRVGRVYDQKFYNRYHHGQGPGWQKGYQAGAHYPPPPSNPKHRPEAVAPGYGHQPPAQPGHYQPGPPASRDARPGRERATGQYQPGPPAAREQGPGREGPMPHRPAE